MGRINSLSPVRSRKSPHTKSPSLRERSPVRQRAAYAEKLSSRGRSRKHVRSRSPEHHSPPREKLSSRTKSSKRGKSSSPDKEEYPPRTRSPKRVKLTSSVSPSREKLRPITRTRSPRRARSRSLESSSLSPRSKRLMRAKAERDPERGSAKGNEVNHGRKGDRSTYVEKDSYREFPVEKEDRRPRNSVDNDSSKSRHRRAAPPSANHRKDQRRSRSPSDSEKKGRVEIQSSRDAEQGNGDNDSIAKMKAAEDTLEAKEVKEKQKPSFELSGKLAAETNRFRGVTLLFNEPPDARKPDVRWRLYVFKGGEVLNEPLYVHRQSCYLFGRERRVADIPTDHPSCSKQHAVLQYREVEEENPDGTMSKRVRPYLMDLGTTNGTSLNDSPIEPQRYYELFEKDTIKFGNSSREYVLLHENSAT